MTRTSREYLNWSSQLGACARKELKGLDVGLTAVAGHQPSLSQDEGRVLFTCQG